MQMQMTAVFPHAGLAKKNGDKASVLTKGQQSNTADPLMSSVNGSGPTVNFSMVLGMMQQGQTPAGVNERTGKLSVSHESSHTMKGAAPLLQSHIPATAVSAFDAKNPSGTLANIRQVSPSSKEVDRFESGANTPTTNRQTLFDPTIGDLQPSDLMTARIATTPISTIVEKKGIGSTELFSKSTSTAVTGNVSSSSAISLTSGSTQQLVESGTSNLRLFQQSEAGSEQPPAEKHVVDSKADVLSGDVLSGMERKNGLHESTASDIESSQLSQTPTSPQVVGQLASTDTTAQSNTLSTTHSDAALQLGNMMVHHVSSGSNQFQVKVSPEGMGNLTISVTRDSNGVSIHVQASQETTLNWLGSQAADLKGILKDAGVSLNQLQMSMGQSNLGNSANGQSQNHNQRQNSAVLQPFQTQSTGTTTQSVIATSANVRATGLSGKQFLA